MNVTYLSNQGVKENSKEVGLEDKVKIDLVVIGSVAVSRTGKVFFYFYILNPIYQFEY